MRRPGAVSSLNRKQTSVENTVTCFLTACSTRRRPHGRAWDVSDRLTRRHNSDRGRERTRVLTFAARVTRGRRCCIAQLHIYFESHDLRCSSKKARTCSGSSAPKNSTPAGSGSGQKTLSGVGTFGGLASMIFLLYKPIICLGPRFALEPDAGHILFVALTAQPNNGTECLNRIYRLSVDAPISLWPVKPRLYFHTILPSLVPRGIHHEAPTFSHRPVLIGYIKPIMTDFVRRRIRQDFLLKARTFVNYRSLQSRHSALIVS